MKNTVISPMTMLVDVVRDEKGRSGFPVHSLSTPLDLTEIANEKNRSNVCKSENLALSLEAYLRKMIAKCAVKVYIPYNQDYWWLSPRQLKALLAQTTKKSVQFVDRHDKYWRATIEYLKPLWIRIGSNQILSSLVWDIYMLILSVKHKSEVVLPPKKTLSLINKLDRLPDLDSEGRARLAVLAGIFNCFEPTVPGPSLRFTKSAFKLDVTNRIEEILEDAYLLEASRLRRLLGLRQNVLSIKRDLRKLLSFISSKRSWAKGLVEVGSSIILGGNASIRAFEKLIEIIPALETCREQPVLTNYGEYEFGEDKGCIEVIRKIECNAFRLYTHSTQSNESNET